MAANQFQRANETERRMHRVIK